jgi:putative ABC transport system permease protein
MLRHIAIAAFRNLAANKLISAIAILGLSAGVATALLMALVVKSQLSFDHFIPGHERTYRMFWQMTPQMQCTPQDGGSSVYEVCSVAAGVKEELLNYPAVEKVAQIFRNGTRKVRHGAVTGWEPILRADADFFDVVPLPVLHGDLKRALASPDGIVIDRSTARRYFGRDDPVGQSLTIGSAPTVVRAVIEDLPRNGTTLSGGIFRSFDCRNPSACPMSWLYLRLKPGAVFNAAQATEAMWRSPAMKGQEQRRDSDGKPLLRDAAVLALDRIHVWEVFNPGIRLRLGAAAITGALVLLIAAINFVNLMVARAVRREREVGVRKACGGDRRALMLQFLGEAVVTVGIAAAIGLALAEWLLPFVNVFLDTDAVLVWGDTVLLLGLPCAVLLLALGAGAWPALVLSGFRPAPVLRGARAGGTGALARGALVTLQFSVLIVLAIAGAVMWLQRDFAAREALRVDSDQMLLVRLGEDLQPNLRGLWGGQMTARDLFAPQACPAAFIDAVRKLPGVRGAVCADDGYLSGGDSLDWETLSGSEDYISTWTVDPRIFALYGIRPIAGVLPRTAGADEPIRQTGVIVNLSALRKLGFASPQTALGKAWLDAVRNMAPKSRKMLTDAYGAHAVITAVVPDFWFYSVRTEIPPAMYTPWADVEARSVHIKLSGRDIPQTLAAIDRIYAQSGIDRPLDRFFLDDYMQAQYRDVTRDAQFFAGTAAIAIILACMGLVGIAISTAERRTKEIGVRKAMGATTPRILGLLLWQFSLPVLAASLVAWPIAWWLMRRWLAGFVYRIELEWWIFAGASGLALLLALVTVVGQALQTARQKPVLALRYE